MQKSYNRYFIDQEIKEHDNGYGLQTQFDFIKPKVGGVRFVTMGGCIVELESSIQNSLKRDQLIRDFQLALKNFDFVKMKTLLQEKDLIVYEVKDQKYVIRNTPLSFQELDFINPLPDLLKAYVKPLRFDEYWGISQYFPGLGSYNVIRHFENFFESASSDINSSDYAIGLAEYIVNQTSQESHIRIIECGAGTGDGLLRLLIAFKHMVPLMILDIYVVETSETLILTQQYKLSAFNVKWVNDMDVIFDDGMLTVINCEMVLDSFPHRAFRKEQGIYKEAYLTKKGIMYQEVLSSSRAQRSDPKVILAGSLYCIRDDILIDDIPEGYTVYRSFAAEEFVKKIIHRFRRLIFLSLDHVVGEKSIHLVSDRHKAIDFYKHAGEFLMACSLNMSFYQKMLDGFSSSRTEGEAIQSQFLPGLLRCTRNDGGNHLSYEITRASSFFKKHGDFRVYQDDPRFVMMVVKKI